MDRVLVGDFKQLRPGRLVEVASKGDTASGRARVDLPAALGPITPRAAPGARVNVTPLSTGLFAPGTVIQSAPTGENSNGTSGEDHPSSYTCQAMASS